MRENFRLVFTASFLFLSPGVQGSDLPNDDHTKHVAQVAGTMQVPPAVLSATSSTSQDLKCYYTVDGKRKRLFGHRGNLRDRRIPVGDPSVPSALTLSSSQSKAALDRVALPSDQLEPPSLIEKTRQPGNITGLHFLLQTTILEWLAADPQGRHNLLRTCRYYRAFVMPILGETHSISPSLRKDLLISIIAGQTGDVKLFFRDQRKTFQQCDISELKEAIDSRYYVATLSAKTPDGIRYRSIGPTDGRNYGDPKHVSLGGLRLVPLNFSGAEKITRLYLEHDLGNNNPLLITMPCLDGLRNLRELYVDAAWGYRKSFLDTIRDLNAKRDVNSQIVLVRCRTNIRGQLMCESVKFSSTTVGSNTSL